MAAISKAEEVDMQYAVSYYIHVGLTNWGTGF